MSCESVSSISLKCPLDYCNSNISKYFSVYYKGEDGQVGQRGVAGESVSIFSGKVITMKAQQFAKVLKSP